MTASAWSLTESHGGVMQYDAASPNIHTVNIDWDEINTPDNPEYVTWTVRAVKGLPKEHRHRILTGIRRYWKIKYDSTVEWIG